MAQKRHALSLRISEETKTRLQALSDENNRSITNWIETQVEKEFKNLQKRQAKV